MHMKHIMRRISLVVFPLLCTLIFSLVLQTRAALAATTLLQVSNDPFTNTSSQHQTEVEPDTFSFGSTIVTAFQTGRISGGG
ncbi:MAG TPA: hypothetical protein VFV38_14985, partial [Ktedonobacteraceae bacterium]|nr:hypothetical protein [Ktedonobacteraceae bacterium]